MNNKQNLNLTFGWLKEAAQNELRKEHGPTCKVEGIYFFGQSDHIIVAISQDAGDVEK